jgi:hypothetical protein
MIKRLVRAATMAALFAMTAPASATTWVDWTSSSPTTASGIAGSTTVTFNSTAPVAFVQMAPATNYYNPWPAGALQPDNTDIIALSEAGVRTLSFSQPVSSLILALVSWNVPGNVEFSSAFTSSIIGCGFWGCGSIAPGSNSTFFTPSGEVHGNLAFQGPITSLSFSSGGEFWHGFTVGVTAVPEPATWLTMLLGFGLIGAGMRTRRRRSIALA